MSCAREEKQQGTAELARMILRSDARDAGESTCAAPRPVPDQAVKHIPWKPV